jgi:hypothetical protein
MNLFGVAREIADRLTRIFLRDPPGRRQVFGDAEKFWNTVARESSDALTLGVHERDEPLYGIGRKHAEPVSPPRHTRRSVPTDYPTDTPSSGRRQGPRSARFDAAIADPT